MIAHGDFVTLPFCGTALQTHRRRSINIKFIRRVWKNDRTNIPTFDDKVVLARKLMQFLRDNLANQRKSADAGNVFVYAMIAQVVREIDIINDDARLVVLKTACDRGGL